MKGNVKDIEALKGRNVKVSVLSAAGTPIEGRGGTGVLKDAYLQQGCLVVEFMDGRYFFEPSTPIFREEMLQTTVGAQRYFYENIVVEPV